MLFCRYKNDFDDLFPSHLLTYNLRLSLSTAFIKCDLYCWETIVLFCYLYLMLWCHNKLFKLYGTCINSLSQSQETDHGEVQCGSDFLSPLSFPKAVTARESGIKRSSCTHKNTQAVCGKYLSHAEGLKFVVRTRSRHPSNRQTRSFADSHLEVKAGKADRVVLLLLTLSLLKQHGNTK